MIYVIIAIVLVLAELGYFWVANRFNIIDKPNMRSSHTKITLRGGGIVFYFGVLLYSVLYGLPYPWFLLGLTLIAGISFVDDIRPVSNKIRLLVHFAAMLLLFYEWGLYTGFPLWYVLIALIFCTGVINAYNFMDGINGITGGYSLVVLAMLALINGRLVPFMDPAFLFVCMLSVGVFNLFNFRTRARCFAGDVGAVGIAFIILFALGKLILVSGDLSYIILLAVYGVDSILTIVHRLMLHENIFDAHRKHAYQLMANELKLPHVGVSAFYAVLQGLIVAGYLAIFEYRLWYVASVIVVLSVAYILFMRKYFCRHQRRAVV